MKYDFESNSNPSQCDKILTWFFSGGSLTAIQALKLFGCMRLASRVKELRDHGYNIQKVMVKTKNKKTFAKYFFVDIIV